MALEPGDDFAVGHRAEAYAALGNDDLALADAGAALRLNARWIDLRLLRANIFRRRDQAADGIREADEIVKDRSASSFALVAAANIYNRFGHSTEAMVAYDRALSIKPEPFIYINRAANRPRSDINGRKADLEKALALDPNDVDALTARAIDLLEQGDFPASISLFDHALIREPQDMRLKLQRAIVTYKLGRTKEAEAAFAAWRAKATTPTEFNSLCWAKATNGIMLDSALLDCREALQKSPEIGGYLDSLGMAYLRLGRYDEAIATYDKAIGKGVGAVSLLGRAIAHQRKGEKKLAAADRTDALRRDPDIELRFKTFGLKFDDAPAAAVAQAK